MQYHNGGEGEMARFQVINEVCTDHETVRPLLEKEVPEFKRVKEGDWTLCLQWGRYFYDDGGVEEGYRFVWRRPNKTLQAARGQARLPSLKVAELLIQAAREAGWGGYVK